MEADRWFFVDDKGHPSSIDEAELRDGLLLKTISPRTWVWRPSWKEWVRAEHVRPLRNALGHRARDFKDPVLDPCQQTPPPVPALDEEDRIPRRSTPVPAPNDHPKALIRRPAQPTLTELSAPTSSGAGGTLRPPGAVPPPPRGIPRPLLVGAEGADTNAAEPFEAPSSVPHPHPTSSVPVRSSSPAARPVPTHVRDGALEPAVELPEEELSAPEHLSHAATANYDPDSIEARQALHDLHPRRASEPKTISMHHGATAVALAMGVLTASAGFWLTLRNPPRTLPSPTHTTSTTPSASPLTACAPSRPAQRIAPSLLMTVSPIATNASATGRMLVGFAENVTTAVGISVDPNDLDISIPFREENEARVISVTPLGSYGPPQFFVSRETLPLQKSRLVEATRNFLFGLSSSGFSRQFVGEAVELVWAVDSKTSVTDPRISSISGLAHAVTFRSGGQTGAIMLGWLTESGQSLAGPYQIESAVEFVGTPALATNGDTAWVTFAGRTSDSAPWSLYLSEAKVGQPPTPARSVAQSTGGPGGDSISPALISVDAHRWLLQWSEGPQGQRQVRIQTLDAHGVPGAAPHTVSPLGSNSGQGLLWSSGRAAVSLFVVSVGKSAELWATPLACPE